MTLPQDPEFPLAHPGVTLRLEPTLAKASSEYYADPTSQANPALREFVAEVARRPTFRDLAAQQVFYKRVPAQRFLDESRQDR